MKGMRREWVGGMKRKGRGRGERETKGPALRYCTHV